MKSLVLAIIVSFCGTVFSAPNFITPNMMKRNGLTDEQYQNFWKIGKNPRIDQAAAREWMFRASRYQNVTNWLDIIGKTNNFARLVVPTIATNEWLSATNKVLTGTVGKLRRDLEKEIERADEAQHDADIYKALMKAAKRTEKNINKIVKTIEQAKKKAQTEEEIALYNALIAILQGSEPNLYE